MALFVYLFFIGATYGNVIVDEKPSAMLLLATGRNIQMIALDYGDVMRTNLTMTGKGQVMNIDYDPIDGHVYWTGKKDRAIRRALLNGSGEQILVNNTKMRYNDDIVVDWVSRHLYWIDGGRNRIEVARLDGTSRQIIISEDMLKPKALCVDSKSGYMWWTNKDSLTKLPVMERAFLDGSNRHVIINKDLVHVYGFTVDSKNARLLWHDSINIMVANLDGTMRKMLAYSPLGHRYTLENVQGHGAVLAILDSQMYWLNPEYLSTAIYRANKDTGDDITTVIDHLPTVKDFRACRVDKPFEEEDAIPCNENNGGCSHLCFPLPGYKTCSDINRRRKCACPTTHTLNPDGLTCSEGETMLLIADGQHLHMTSLDLMVYKTSTLPVSRIQQARHVDYDPVEGHVYWTDAYGVSIRKALLNGSNEKKIIERRFDNMGGIAVDATGRKLYWADEYKKTINVANLDGSSQQTIISEGLVSPRDICVDSHIGYIWWINLDHRSKLERALLDGTRREIIVKDNIGWPKGIAVDSHEQKLYWCDTKFEIIEMANLDGSMRKQLLHNTLRYAHGLSLLGDYIYWSDTHQNTVQRVNKYYGGHKTIILDNLSDVRGVKATYVNEKQTGRHVYSESTASLTNLKTDKEESRRTVGVRDTKHNALLDTADDGDGLLLLVAGNRLQALTVVGSDVINDTTLLASDVGQAIHIDYDPVEGHVYWVDNITLEIRRSLLDGSDKNVLVKTDVGAYGGIAIDWNSRHVYWTDYIKHSIEVIKMNGDSRSTIVYENLYSPQELCVNANKGYLWWIDNAVSPRIERSQLDGSQREVIVNNDLTNPKGITVDDKDQRLYWMDLKLDRIESTGLDGTDRRLMCNVELDNANGLHVLGGFLYWTNRKNVSSIQRVSKTTGDNITSIRETDQIILSLTVANTRPVTTEKSTCDENNGGCSHLCFPLPDAGLCSFVIKKHKCACPNTHTINSDGLTCSDSGGILLVAGGDKDDLFYYDEESFSNFTLVDVMVHQGHRIVYDPVTEHLYYDHWMRNIMRSFLNGSDEKVVLKTHGVKIRGLAIDWIGRYIYWIVDTSLEAVQLDGPFRKRLITGIEYPGGLFVDAVNGYIFWISNTKTIERCLLDGSERITVMNEQDLREPAGIVVDSQERKLYWGDIKQKTINVADLDGKNPKVLIHELMTRPIGYYSHVHGLTLMGEFIYWVGLDSLWIERANKRYGGDRSIVRLKKRLTGYLLMSLITGITKKKSSKVTTVCSDTNGGCSHMCFSIRHTDANGTITMRPKCACPSGYKHDPDNDTCLEPKKGMIVYAYDSYIMNLTVHPDSNETQIVNIFDKDDAEVYAIAFDPVEERVYWIRYSYYVYRFSIWSSVINGSATLDKRVLMQNVLNKPTRIAVDWIGRKLYLLTMDLPSIVVARLDGSLRKVIISSGLQKPLSMCIDVYKGFIWWTDAGDSPKIERAYIDGSNREVIINTNLRDPTQITADSKENKIYWFQPLSSTVEVSNMDGTDRRQVLSGIFGRVTEISALGRYLYIVAYKDGLSGLFRIEKNNSTDMYLVRRSISPENGIAVSFDEINSEIRLDECSDNNGGCAELCFGMGRLHIGDRRRCACQTNHRLNSDNVTCSEINTKMLFMAKERRIRRLTVDYETPEILEQQDLPIKVEHRWNKGEARSVSIDTIHDYTYWLDRRIIRRSQSNDYEAEVIVDGSTRKGKPAVIKPFDLVIDPYSETLFWTCAMKNAINVMSMSKRANGVIVKGTSKLKPRYLAINSNEGLLYWTNNGRKPAIQRSRLDGSETVMVISNLYNPGFITINHVDNALCWVDKKRKSVRKYSIECSDLNGRNKRLIMLRPIAAVNGVTVLWNHVYWLESSKLLAKNIRGEDKKLTTLLDETPVEFSSLTVDMNEHQGTESTHPCLNTELDCSHICMAKTKDSAMCLCPIDSKLAVSKEHCTQ